MLCAIGASFVFQVLTRPTVGYNWVVSGMVVGVLDSVMDSVLDPLFVCVALSKTRPLGEICFSLEANASRYNPELFGTFLGECLRRRAPAY